jgi:inorganic pyrophosphatase/exopolyphosphatase
VLCLTFGNRFDDCGSKISEMIFNDFKSFFVNSTLSCVGKGQNVKNQNVKSPKRTLKVQKEHQKSERQKSFLDFRRSDLF